MTVHAPFQGVLGANQTVTPSGTSASITLAGKNKSVRLVNSGASICHVRIGAATQTATTADTPVQSGESLIVQKFEEDKTVAYISAGGTTLQIQPGEGGY